MDNKRKSTQQKNHELRGHQQEFDLFAKETLPTQITQLHPADGSPSQESDHQSTQNTSTKPNSNMNQSTGLQSEPTSQNSSFASHPTQFNVGDEAAWDAMDPNLAPDQFEFPEDYFESSGENAYEKHLENKFVDKEHPRRAESLIPHVDNSTSRLIAPGDQATSSGNHNNIATSLAVISESGTEAQSGTPTQSRQYRATTLKIYEQCVQWTYQYAQRKLRLDDETPYPINPTELAEQFLESFAGGKRTKAAWRINRAAILWHLNNGRHKSPENPLSSNATQYHRAYDLIARTTYEAACERNLGGANARIEGSRYQIPPESNAAHDDRLLSDQSGLETEKPDFADDLPGQSRAKTSTRSIPKRHLDALIKTLSRYKGGHLGHAGAPVIAWLRAGLACGARVNEWTGVQWADRDKGLLLIPNSKIKLSRPAMLYGSLAERGLTVHDAEHLENTNKPADPADHSHGLGQTRAPYDPQNRPQHRVVRIQPENRQAIDSHLLHMSQYIRPLMARQGVSLEQAFESYYQRCRKTLSRACHECFGGKHLYSLRTARGQFAANAKAANPLSDVSEMMGHTNTRTTMGFYGYRSQAHSGAYRSVQQHQQRQKQAASDSPN